MLGRVFVQVFYLMQVRGRLGWTIACRRRAVRGRYIAREVIVRHEREWWAGCLGGGDEGWALIVSGKVCVCRVGCRRVGVVFW